MPPLNITRVDAARDDLPSALARIRDRLSPRGNIVSEAGRRRTIEVFGEPLTPQQVVERICTDVRERGMPALLEYSTKLDGAQLDAKSLRVPAEELERAHASADAGFLATIRRIRDNVLRFQSAILARNVQVELDGGGYLAQRYLPLARVGVCVPGGAAAYPSTVLMTAVPAQAAGVRELAVIAPPTKFGSYNPDLLATCHELGIREVYRIGGAQGVAALAYGVEGITKVDKIVGPGNMFVALAKQFVFGEVDIDSIAGPSEVVVVADETARPDFTAADLIAQAEHAPGASILVSWSKKLLDDTAAELERQLAELSRGELARQSLEDFGALILVRDAREAAEVANSLAAEHLHIAAENAEAILQQIPHAGAAFLGHYSPVALGDYVAGPSHVLPTGGTARYASALSSNDFVRATSVISFSRTAMERVAGDVQTMADKEQLSAHRHSVDVRLQGSQPEGKVSP